ncbi:hypothetical protein [Bosea sp. MMO-172]|uniref:hypothetical protein n=1 Tax=Bosea sp. MMO-172 TaxID=3127885 RepID=UPI003019A5E7
MLKGTCRAWAAFGSAPGPLDRGKPAPQRTDVSLRCQEISTVKLPIVIHTEEDYDRAQQRVEELNAMPDGADKERELHALAEAMLAFELRRDDADD